MMLCTGFSVALRQSLRLCTDTLWQYRGDACADLFNEPLEGASTRQEVREETTRSHAASHRNVEEKA